VLPSFEWIIHRDRHRRLPYQDARRKVRNGTLIGLKFAPYVIGLVLVGYAEIVITLSRRGSLAFRGNCYRVFYLLRAEVQFA